MRGPPDPRHRRARGRCGAGGRVRRLGAGTVVSNLDPWTTYLDLIDASCLEPGFRAAVERLPRRGSAFKVALALDGIPGFAAAPRGLERACAGCQFRIAPSIEYQDRAFEDVKNGRPSRDPVFWGLFPTMADPTLAPPGRPHPERQRLPRPGRAARREMGDRARPVRRALHRRPGRVPAGVEGQDRRPAVLEPCRSGGGVRPARRQHHASRHDAAPHVRAAPRWPASPTTAPRSRASTTAAPPPGPAAPSPAPRGTTPAGSVLADVHRTDRIRTARPVTIRASAGDRPRARPLARRGRPDPVEPEPGGGQ